MSKSICRSYRHSINPERQARRVSGLTKGTPIVVSNPKSCFKFHFDIMYGDADFYEKLDLFLPTEDDDIAADFVNFVHTQLSVAYPNGRGGGEEYNYENSPHCPDWNKWFGEGDYTKEGTYIPGSAGIFTDTWPSNWDYGGGEGSFDGLTVTMFDEDGQEFSVILDGLHDANA